MAISIKNEETERLARKLAKMTGESLTDAIREALAEKYERLNRERTRRARIEELNQIALRCASLPRISDLSDDEILGYDENGLPT
ncbi:MAG TPA: type II toxin-antitoxin system VapB family antitoxin [Bryobacteraceae bacterium]|nr:type II toxin-antitoxin system VapB family antitoxin [Bryobacteraceae bacterium]